MLFNCTRVMLCYGLKRPKQGKLFNATESECLSPAIDTKLGIF